MTILRKQSPKPSQRRETASKLLVSEGPGRLLVLSYHSWDTPAEALREDVRHLRGAGWSAIGRREFLSGPISRDCFLVTTDDGHAEDEGFFAALAEEECPAVTFVNVGRIPQARIGWYRERAKGDAVAVEDHGEWHRRHPVSSGVTGWATTDRPREDVAHLDLPRGYPMCALGGEIAAPRFVPHPEIAHVVRKLADETAPELVGSASWAAHVEQQLIGFRLASRRLGRLHLRGRFETWGEFEARARTYIEQSRRAFERAIGVAPRLYAYTWWQGSERVDQLLRDAGYSGSFWGRGRLHRGSSTFGVPRIEVSPLTPRPLRVESIPRWRPLGAPAIEVARAFAKQLLGVR